MLVGNHWKELGRGDAPYPDLWWSNRQKLHRGKQHQLQARVSVDYLRTRVCAAAPRVCHALVHA